MDIFELLKLLSQIKIDQNLILNLIEEINSKITPVPGGISIDITNYVYFLVKFPFMVVCTIGETINLINPDLFELALTYIHQMGCVLNGVLTLALRYLGPNEVGVGTCFSTETLFRHSSLEALDAELLSSITDKLYISDPEFVKNITKPGPGKLKLKGIDMFYVKYSHIDFVVAEYYNFLYNKLQKQTNGFDPIKLGKQVVLLPANIPSDFDGVVQIFEPLTEEFRLFAKYMRSSYYVEEPFKDMASLREFMNMHAVYYPDEKTYIKNVCEFMAPERDVGGLSLEKIESYRANYEACITITRENCLLYTRSRCILNTFVDLNHHVIKHIASDTTRGGKMNEERIYEYIGMAARNIITNQHHAYLDGDNYPVISELYRSGSIRNRLFPESINYTRIQKLCFCQGCKPFEYTAQLYDGKDGKVYILVSLKGQDYTNYIDFIKSQRCMYELFISDIEYHYGRLDALDLWRYKVEVAKHREHVPLEVTLELLERFGQNPNSPYRRTYLRMVDADYIFETRRNDGF